MKYVRIIQPPLGEAPPHIRAAWVGTILPLSLPFKHTMLTYKGLTGHKYVLARMFSVIWANQVVGYRVESATAIEILERTQPEAAQWWRSNAPHSLKPGRNFAFDAAACEELDLEDWPPPPKG